MGFLSNIVSAAVKVTPIAVVKDVAKVAVGIEPDSTKELIESVGKYLSKSFVELENGNLL